MKRFLSFAIFLFLVVSLQVGAQVKWSKAGYAATLKKAAASDSYVLMDFYAEWCGPCRELDHRTWNRPEAGNFLHDKNILALKLDAEKEGRLPAKRYDVKAFPTVILVNGKGDEITRFLGFMSCKEVTSFLEKALKDPRSEAQLWKAVQADPGNVRDSFTLAQRLMSREPGKEESKRIVKLFDTVIKGDPDNVKHMGAQALLGRVALGIRSAFRFDTLVNSISKAVFPGGPFPDIHDAGADPELSERFTDLSKAAAAYCERLKCDCARQLLSARKAMLTMKNPDADPSPLLRVEYLATDKNRCTNRGLCDAYYLFLASSTKNPAALNNCAWYFYRTQDHLELAEKLARQAVAHGNDPFNNVDTLAHVLFSRGKIDEALAMEKTIIEKAEKSGNKAMASAFRKSIASWKRGKADQLFPNVAILKSGKVNRPTPETPNAPATTKAG